MELAGWYLYRRLYMRRKLTGFVLGAALSVLVAVPIVGLAGPAFADSTPNGKNCVGVDFSTEAPPGHGPVVSAFAKTNEPGSVAAAIQELRSDC
jgi:nicotinamide mononucleotide (NMN) deamidase PncC